MESMWHRPRLYHTVVVAYLFFNVIYATVLTIEDYNHRFPHGPSEIDLSSGYFNFYSGQIFTAIFVSLSITGSVLLLRKKKAGIIVSFFALVWSGMLASLNTFPGAPPNSSYAINYSDILIGFFAFAFLILGSKVSTTVIEKTSRWKRPNLYITIVNIFILVVGLIPFAVALGFAYQFSENVKSCGPYCPPGGTGIGAIYATGALLIAGILATLSIFSSISLWRCDRNGIEYSLVTLVFMSLIFTLLSLWIYFIGVPLLVSAGFMFVLLSKNKKLFNSRIAN